MKSRSILMLLASILVCVPSAALAVQGDCGQPVSNGEDRTTSDALFVLQAAVGSQECELCVCDVDDSGEIDTSDALNVLRDAVDLDSARECPECGIDTSSQCPGVAQFALFSSVRGPCTSNTDCAAFSVCDPDLGRCRTATDVDVGWTGLAHNADTDDPVPARLFLDCEGPAPCGQCEITGHDPSLGNCRCAGDNRTRCFTVAGPDEENCGGEQCICYFGPPMPLSAGNTPTCVLNTLAGQPGGTANVDEGSGSIEIHLNEKVHLGIGLTTPCPLCVNDPTPADGMRGGTCMGGEDNGETCDAQAYNATFPPPTGGFYSLDCMPLAGANITGSGLLIDVTLTTGQSTLTADLPCAADGPNAELDCHCLSCSGDTRRGCSSDADCSEHDAGTCSSIGQQGTQPQPNGCTDLLCEDVGGGEGTCTNGPDDTFCAGLVRANGAGFITCNSNEDCDPVNIGVDAGDCTLVERRPCFLDTIVAQGAPHPVIPLGAGTFCAPATSAGGVNLAAGLPGPGRLELQTLVSLFCKNSPMTQYQPGVGGCPAPE
ncbi:MAG TPA: hypothetical protein VEC57_05515 [Candidatus Limnocylindrales bacterium]|nr:hypothetical protein [Candidatus Limnocylindrales bacterium]